MNGFFRFILSHPVAMSMFYIALIVLGVISYQNISVEGQPDTELPQLVVRTSWGSSSPEVVQVFLTSPIEEVAAQIEGLEEMESSSTSGISEVTLRFTRDTDMEFARLDLNERLSNLRAALPPGAQQPNITMIETDETNTDRFMRFDITGPFDMQELSDLYNDFIRDEISSVDGVAEVELRGEREKSLNIKLDRTAMDLYGLIPDTVANRVAELTQVYEAPRTTYNNTELTITIMNSILSTQDVENLAVAKYKDQLIRLKDIGTIELGHARVLSLSRLNGNPTLQVTIQKEVGASVIETARNVRAKIKAVLPSLPATFRLEFHDDQGEMMEEQLSSIYERSSWCIVLIIALLLIFLQSLSAAVVITLNILFSVLITINFMYYFKVTFNIITLSGLAIGFGMLVDNAIVVLENIFRFREMGYSRMDAAIEGVRDIVWAVLAATLTTVAAFLCMVFLEDRLAVTYWPLALSVTFSLSASMLVSFTFTPLLSLLIRGSNLEHKKTDKPSLVNRLVTQPLERATGLYGKAVLWTLHHKMLVFVVVGAFLFMFVKIFSTEIDTGDFNFRFSPDDKVMVYVRMPEGAELETADDVIRQFETPLLELEKKAYRDMSVTVYNTSAIMEITFAPEILASAYPLALKSKLISIAQRFAGVGIYVGGISSDDNFSSGSTGFESYNSSIRVLGYNYKRLMDYGENLLRLVERNRRVKATKLETSRRTFRQRDQTETVLIINREALRQYDISVAYLMGFLQVNLREETRRFTKYQGEEMMVEVKFEDNEEFDIKALENLIVITPSNQRIRLADLVTISERTVPGGIDRKDQQYMVNVKWDYKGSPKKARDYNDKIFDSLALPSGFKAEREEDNRLSDEETSNLHFVIYLALVLVFMIIAALYESFVDPLVIFATIPLSFVGVSWIYWKTGNSFDSTAYIGLIILAGIVVNNSILLVSHINHEIHNMDQSGLSFNEAIARAAQDRLRPIMLTAITTIVGLLPLLEEFVNWLFGNPIFAWVMTQLNISVAAGNAENYGLQDTLKMFGSLSRSTVGGMLTATLSTLLVIPMVYAVFFRAKQWLHWRITEVFSISGPEHPNRHVEL